MGGVSQMALADLAAAGHRAGWLKLYEMIGRGWFESHDGFVAAVSGLSSVSYNGVIVYGDHDHAELSDTLGRVSDSGLPFSLQTRPAVADAVSTLAQALAMDPQAGLPLMGTAEPPPAVEIAGLALRALAADEGDVHAEIAAEVFGAPVALLRMMSRPERLGAPGVHFLVGEIDGAPVTTAMVDVNGEAAWIFDVATLSRHRRRGLGSAITAATARAAFADGASAVYLLSMPMAVGVYERLGFHQLEWWSSWTQRRDA